MTVSPIAMEYLGCEIDVAENYLIGWIGQPDLYKNLEKKFNNMLKGQRATETPSTPGFHVVCNIPKIIQKWSRYVIVSSETHDQIYQIALGNYLKSWTKPQKGT